MNPFDRYLKEKWNAEIDWGLVRLYTVCVLTSALLIAVMAWGILDYTRSRDALATCLDYGYPDAKIVAGRGYCITRTDCEDKVISVEELRTQDGR